MTRSDGTVEYVTLERADEPTEVGTAINKALFDSIRYHILSTNTYTQLAGITNRSYTSPTLTTSNLQGYTVGWNYYCVATNAPSSPCEFIGGDGTKYMRIGYGESSSELYFQLNVTMPKYVRLSSIQFGIGNDVSPYLVVTASTNNSSFETIYSGRLDSSSKVASTNIVTDKAFKYFRFRFTNVSTSNYARISNDVVIKGTEFDAISKTEVMKYNLSESIITNELFPFLTPSTYIVPSNATYKINVKNVSGSVIQTINMPTCLPAGNKFALMYNGSKMELVESFVTGTFTWNRSSNTNINVGFKPKTVIIVSQVSTGWGSRGFSCILTEKGSIMFCGNDGAVEYCYSRSFDNSFNDTGFTVPPYNYVVTDSNEASSVGTNYIAFA